MALTNFNFIGDVSWIQTAYPQWTVDGFGVDHASVRYSGAKHLKEAFQDSLVKFSTMIGAGAKNSMSLENWTDGGGTPNILNLDLHYIGFRSGVIPQVKSVDSLSYQSAQGSGTDTATGDKVSGTIYYFASRTTWTWFETTTPAQLPRYNTVNNAIDPFSQIQGYSMNDVTTGESNNSIPYSSFVAILNSLAKKVIVCDYTKELLIPGKLWQCSSSVDYKIGF